MQMYLSVSKLSSCIKCTTMCSEYYYDLQSSNPLFNSNPLFSFFGVSPVNKTCKRGEKETNLNKANFYMKKC